MEQKMSQPVVVRMESDHLLGVLSRVSKSTGVRLKVGSPLAETHLVARYEGPLSGFMEALAAFFAVDKDHRATWRENNGIYTLERDPDAQQALLLLRKERQEETVRALEGALCTQNPVVLPLKVLDREHRGVVYAGGTVEVNQAAPHWAELRQELLAHGEWSPTTRMVVSLVGPSRQTRRLAWGWLDDEQGHGQEESAWLYEMAPELGIGPQQAKAERRYGFDRKKASFPSIEGHLAGWGSTGDTPRAHLVTMIADHFQVNLIAEDHRQLVSRIYPSDRRLPALLDAICQPTVGSLDAPGAGIGYFWRKTGDVYLIRSLDWQDEEARILAP